MNIEAISLFMKIDGRLVLAPVAAESAQLFIGILPAFQEGRPAQAKVYVMPQNVADHVEAAGRELGEVLQQMRVAAHG